MGSEFFNKVQYGKESTRGTAVAATQMWIGQMQALRSDRRPTYPKEHFGVRADSLRSVIHQRYYTNTLSTEHGAFQHLPMLFGSLKGGVTPVEQTTGQGDYLWDFTPSMTGANTPDAFTLEFGDDAQAYEVEYCLFESIRIRGQVTQGMDASPVGIEAALFGRQIAETTFTGSLSPRTLEPLNSKYARLYLDTSWAGVGGTEISDLLRTFDVEILTGVHAKFAGSATPTFTRHAEGVLGVVGTFGIEGGSSAASIFSDQQAATFSVLRLAINGGQIGSGENFNVNIDFGGSFEDATPISSSDRGDNLAQFTLRGYYSASDDKMLGVTVTTDHNAY